MFCLEYILRLLHHRSNSLVPSLHCRFFFQHAKKKPAVETGYGAIEQLVATVFIEAPAAATLGLNLNRLLSHSAELSIYTSLDLPVHDYSSRKTMVYPA